ncbi:pre-peptidase C-terminal domain-containing protein [Pseudoroseicyclus tamaricis]|uniref:ABC transporter substrate-binding protein n=1 Tax=Pseudoroseicyclus tamaricis TaxID=2705421 RepID=A0A6B2K4H5_9RHOB|nr:pre-peptidase C-terminal domain-containing protein [Pseudoroseicyclus tamaricis]NDV02742.1 ABC transporter substrate-binding protein [Pseudoroseicyclus tamaricis]
MTTHSVSRLALVACMAAGPALPAFAQDLCGGAGANGQWIGGSEADSDIATADDYLQQMALVLMQNEYVSLFTLSEPTEVRMEAQGRGAGDPLFDLRSEDGTILLSDDDSGGDSAARAETMLEPGTYCLSTASYDGSPMTGFVRIGRLEHEALTPGLQGEPIDMGNGIGDGTMGDMGDMGDTGGNTGGGQMPGEICDMSRVTNYFGGGDPVDDMLGGGLSVEAPVNQVAYWGFSLSSPQPLTITAENESADPVITLYDSTGSWLAENDDYEGLNSLIELTQPLPAGDYCLAVRALSDESLPIALTLEAFDPAAQQTALYDNAEAAPPLDGSHPVTMLGPLESRLRQDVQNSGTAEWFAFEVDEAGLVIIEAVTNGLGDPVLTLYDDFGRLVTINDDYGDNFDSLLAARVMPGTYLVALRQYDDSVPVLTRLLFERYVPAD